MVPLPYKAPPAPPCLFSFFGLSAFLGTSGEATRRPQLCWGVATPTKEAPSPVRETTKRPDFQHMGKATQGHLGAFQRGGFIDQPPHNSSNFLVFGRFLNGSQRNTVTLLGSPSKRRAHPGSGAKTGPFQRPDGFNKSTRVGFCCCAVQ